MVIKEIIKITLKNKNIKVVFTGKNTMTGGRIKRLENFLKKENFLLTYGDGLSDVNINKLIKFHKKNKNIVTLTAARPSARFGGIKLSGIKLSILKKNQV